MEKIYIFIYYFRSGGDFSSFFDMSYLLSGIPSESFFFLKFFNVLVELHSKGFDWIRISLCRFI